MQMNELQKRGVDLEKQLRQSDEGLYNTHTHLKNKQKKVLTFYSCSNKLMGYIETRMTKKELFYWGVDLFIIAFCQIHFSVK